MTFLQKSLFTAVLLITTGSSSYATEVSVYAEGEFLNNEQLQFNIYVDITVDAQGPLLSAGVTMRYDCSSDLGYVGAVKNDTDWYVGTSSAKYNYINPVHVAPTGGTDCVDGEVTFLVAKLDKNNPQAGVSGTRVLIGNVTFSYSGTIPTAGQFTLADGHSGAFVDFATTDGHALDSAVNYTTIQIDSDNDGIDDGWEYRYFSENLDRFGATTDYDMDGYTDLQEYLNSLNGVDDYGQEWSPMEKNRAGQVGYIIPRGKFWLMFLPGILNGAK